MKKKSFVLFLSFLITISAFISPAKAAGINVSLSPSSTLVHPGKTFTATLYFSNSTDKSISSFDMSIDYDTSKLEYKGFKTIATASSGEVDISQPSSGKLNIVYLDSDGGGSPIAKNAGRILTLTFGVKANTPKGTAGFNISTGGFSDSGLNSLSASGSKCTVNIGDPLSTNTFLSDLKVDTGTLSPAFSKNQTTYSMSVPFTVEKVTVTGTAEDPKAKVSVSGSKLTAGATTKITVTVTAEDTDVKKYYTINVKRDPDPNVQTAVSSAPASSAAVSSEAPSSTVQSTVSTYEPKQPTGNNTNILYLILTLVAGILIGFIVGQKVKRIL